MKSTPSSISQMIKEVYLLRRSFVTADLLKAVNLLATHSSVPYVDHTFRSGVQFNGWEVPRKWEVTKAKLYFKGKEIYDGNAHPLGVITQCSSFKGKISLAELKKHVFVAEKRPKAIPFHFRLMYRPWESNWGFCMPKKLADSLKPGEYEVDIESKLTKDKMTVREFILKGKSKESMIFVAHIDHAGQANDDVAGCAVAVQLLEEIKKNFPSRRYTYRVLLTQEIVGSVFYLSKLTTTKIKHLKYGMFLEMLGNKNALKLQKSRIGTTYIDQIGQLALKQVKGPTAVVGFRESAGNDEIVFEAPGYTIPMPSLSRWPYDEYHTSDDNMDIISEDKLQEALQYLTQLVFILEHDVKVKRNFTGLVSLANPKYNLYIDPGQVVDGTWGQNADKTTFQYQMPNYLEGNYRISEIAQQFNLDFNWVLDYFTQMKNKKLVTFLK